MADAVASWLARAVADAEARNLRELVPLLETLAKSLRALREADVAFGHPGIPDPRPPSPDPHE